jgi:Na+-transporting NADH:ubiquinone oxidoreductase subunit A
MSVYRVTRGLSLAIVGEPAQQIDRHQGVTRVALVAADYVGMRPTMHVQPGDEVVRGQLLFEDKKIAGVRYTSPAEGRVVSVNRGERRAFQSVVIELSAAEQSGQPRQVALEHYTGAPVGTLTREAVRALLVESGLWTTLRARPFSRVADPAATPTNLFVTAIDTDPLAPDVETVIRGREADFAAGIETLAKLTDGLTFVCTSPSFSIAVPTGDRIRHEQFAGRHPAGTVGFHIHTLAPVGRTRTAWHVGYQDVLDIGRLFLTGAIGVERVVALAGPAVPSPRLIRTRVGASTDELVRGQLVPGDVRVISGSVLSGRIAAGDVFGYLGRYDRQVSALVEGREREFMGWAGPGLRKFSVVGVFLSRLVPRQRFAFTTALNGSLRAIVPIGVYERVMPFDLQPTFLLKAIVTQDVERAEQLGCLELDEEDVALCTFVCPGKNDYGPPLREILSTIEKEG